MGRREPEGAHFGFSLDEARAISREAEEFFSKPHPMLANPSGEKQLVEYETVATVLTDVIYGLERIEEDECSPETWEWVTAAIYDLDRLLKNDFPPINETKAPAPGGN